MAPTDSSLSANVWVLGMLNTSAFKWVIYHHYVTAVYLRSSIFCDIAWCRFVFHYRHFMTTSQSHDVNNQQNATTFSFVNLFKSAQHVSGDKFAHPQEHVLTIYIVFGIMHRHCCRPVPRLRWNCSISTVAPIGSSVGALDQKLYIQSKSAPEDGRTCPKMQGWFKKY